MLKLNPKIWRINIYKNKCFRQNIMLLKKRKYFKMEQFLEEQKFVGL